MKKFICLLLIASTLLMLVSCANTSKKEENSPNTPQTTQAAETTEVAETTEAIQTTEPIHVHTYTNATCQIPATCSTCGNENGVKLTHNVEQGKCSMCGLDFFDELWNLVFTYGTYSKTNISLNGTLMEEAYTYTVQSNFGSDYTCEISVSKLETSENWGKSIVLNFSPGMYKEGEGVLLYIDKASVKNKKYDWSYLGAGTEKISGQIYAPDFSSSTSLECSNTNCNTARTSKLAGYASYEISNILNSAFSELIQKSDKNITAVHFGFEHFE